MIVYTVHEPARPAQDLEERADAVAFVKEGFTWWGFLFGPLWLLFNSLWFEFLAAVALAAGLAYGLVLFGLKDEAASIVNLLLMLVIGFEGNNLLRWRLERKGYTFITPVAGTGFEDCERRFFQAWLPSLPSRHDKPAPKPAMDMNPHSWGGWPGSGVVGTPGDVV
jgi:hypothetical protein